MRVRVLSKRLGHQIGSIVDLDPARVHVRALVKAGHVAPAPVKPSKKTAKKKADS